MRQAYDRRYSPPALVLRVEVSDSGRLRKMDLEAKMDTGASISAIPHRVLADWDAGAAGLVTARGPFDARSVFRPLFRIWIRLPLLGAAWQPVRVLATEEDHFLLGRDILNRFVLHADGPRGVFDVS